jgi:hypothetical protein
MKEEFDRDSVIPYKNSVAQNLEANKQIQKKIDVAFAKGSKVQFQKFGTELKEKNSYFSRSKIPEVNSMDQELKATSMTNKFKSAGLNDEEDGYCQKCPTLKNHCPHKNKKEVIKEKYSYPILSNGTYGWLAPIDNLNSNHNLNSVTKGFYDSSHL